MLILLIPYVNVTIICHLSVTTMTTCQILKKKKGKYKLAFALGGSRQFYGRSKLPAYRYAVLVWQCPSVSEDSLKFKNQCLFQLLQNNVNFLSDKIIYCYKYNIVAVGDSKKVSELSRKPSFELLILKNELGIAIEHTRFGRMLLSCEHYYVHIL